MGKLEGKVAVVTGAASGLGRASALRFAKEGAAVVAADLNSQGGELLVSEIAAAGGRAVYQRSDVTAESDVKALIERAVREYGRLDITYNNAGVIGAMGSIDSTTEADWDKTFAILTKAVFFGIKHSVKPMRQAGGGSNHFDRFDRGNERQLSPARLQRGKGRRDQSYAHGGAGIGQGQDPGELHLPGNHQYSAGPRRNARRQRNPRSPPRQGAGASARGAGRGYREHGDVPGQ